MAEATTTGPTNGGATSIRLDYLQRTTDDHEGRIRFLERAHWRQSAIVGLVSALAALAGAYAGSSRTGAAAASPPHVEARP